MNENQRDQEAMQIIKQSGILNPNTTLDTIFNVTQELTKIAPGDEQMGYTFIGGSGFIYKGGEKQE